MTGTPDVVAPLTPLDIEGLIRPHYRVFPVADHLADKFCAIFGTHAWRGRTASSSRVKDLVDIAIIATTLAIDSEALRIAVVTNAALRRLDLPECFAVPNPVGWAARYPRVAAESPGPVPDYDTAVSLASEVFDPVLDATATGVWDPSVQAWSHNDHVV